LANFSHILAKLTPLWSRDQAETLNKVTPSYGLTIPRRISAYNWPNSFPGD